MTGRMLKGGKGRLHACGSYKQHEEHMPNASVWGYREIIETSERVMGEA